MTTWHQRRAGVNPWAIKKKGWVLVTDDPTIMLTTMSFGENRYSAEDSFEKHTINQPNYTHYLFHNDALQRCYDPKEQKKNGR